MSNEMQYRTIFELKEKYYYLQDKCGVNKEKLITPEWFAKQLED